MTESEKTKMKLSELTDMYDIEDDQPKKKKSKIDEFEEFTVEQDAKYMDELKNDS